MKCTSSNCMLINVKQSMRTHKVRESEKINDIPSHSNVLNWIHSLNEYENENLSDKNK